MHLKQLTCTDGIATSCRLFLGLEILKATEWTVIIVILHVTVIVIVVILHVTVIIIVMFLQQSMIQKSN